MPRRVLPERALNTADTSRAREVDAALLAHARDRRALPGIADSAPRGALVRQVIDSLHRVQFPRVVAARQTSPARADPKDVALFDPVRGAVHHHQLGNHDEACWLVFLFVQFGRHPKGGYRYARDVYGRLGQGGRWDWATVSADPKAFTRWLAAHHVTIKTGGAGGFGSHRKRETLHPHGTGRTVETYVAWIDPALGHRGRFDDAFAAAAGDGGGAFAKLYESMARVHRFGRTARFDYLAMLGKLGLSDIWPARTFLRDSTGPLAGARLLYGVGSESRAATLEQWLIELDADLRIGAQALEDAICNWQKQPDRYRPFRG